MAQEYRKGRVLVMGVADHTDSKVHIEDFGDTVELSLVLPHGNVAVELRGSDVDYLAEWIQRRKGRTA